MSLEQYHFFGFFISDKVSKKIEGIFDIGVKESVSHSSLDLKMSSIIFKKDSFLNCKVSSEDEMFKQVRSLEFLFDSEDDCYIARVFSYKTFEFKSGTDNRIEKDSTPRDDVGIIIIKIISKELFDLTSAKNRYTRLENQKNKRESNVGAY